MASPLANQRKEDFEEDFLTCSICAELYDNDEHKAKCLPCLHTFCLSCLRSIAGKRSHLDCPKCRKLITLPGESVDNLPNNFIVETLKQYQNVFKSLVFCGGCDSGESAVSFCHDCRVFQCQKCADTHHPLQNHNLATIAELQEKKCNPAILVRQQQYCPQHPKQEVTIFCTEAACNTPICATCGLLHHRNHRFVDLSVAVARIISDIEQSTARVTNRNQDLARRRLAVERHQDTLTSNFKKKDREMKESTRELHDQIDRSYTKACSQLQNLYETEMTNLTASLESIDFLAKEMTSACEFANKACDTSHSTSLLASQNQIMDRLHELEEKELPVIATEKTDFDFTQDHHSDMIQIRQLQSDLFKLKWMQPVGQIEQKDVNKRQSTPVIRDRATSGPSARKLQVDSQPCTNQRQPTLIKNRPTLDMEVSEKKPDVDSHQYATQRQPSQVRGQPASALSDRRPQLDPQQCTTRIGLPGKGGTSKVIVQTVDVNGDKMTTGGAKVEATQEKHSLRVKDNKDGTYTFQFNLFWGPLRIKVNGTPIK